MPLVKQGKFREYYNKCEDIKNKAEECHNQYFNKYGYYNYFGDPFTGYFYIVDDIYKEAILMKNKLESLLEIAEQKTDKSVKKCENYIKDMNEVINLCVKDFRSVYDSYNNGFNDMEKDTFPNYDIYKEI